MQGRLARRPAVLPAKDLRGRPSADQEEEHGHCLDPGFIAPAWCLVDPSRIRVLGLDVVIGPEIEGESSRTDFSRKNGFTSGQRSRVPSDNRVQWRSVQAAGGKRAPAVWLRLSYSRSQRAEHCHTGRGMMVSTSASTLSQRVRCLDESQHDGTHLRFHRIMGLVATADDQTQQARSAG